VYIRDRCSKSMEECYIQNSGPRQARVQNGRLTFERRGSCSKRWARVRNGRVVFETTGSHSK
jgi:ribosomal protein L16/L10AE